MASVSLVTVLWHYVNPQTHKLQDRDKSNVPMEVRDGTTYRIRDSSSTNCDVEVAVLNSVISIHHSIIQYRNSMLMGSATLEDRDGGRCKAGDDLFRSGL